MKAHAYPQELVAFILDLQRDPLFMEGLRTNGIEPRAQLPERAVLEEVISVCYQASLLREKNGPSCFASSSAPRKSFQPTKAPQRLATSRLRQDAAVQ